MIPGGEQPGLIKKHSSRPTSWAQKYQQYQRRTVHRATFSPRYQRLTSPMPDLKDCITSAIADGHMSEDAGAEYLGRLDDLADGGPLGDPVILDLDRG